MIKASELRLDNMVLFEPTNKISRICIVKRIENKKILVLDRGFDLVLSDTEINPIQITPESLEKAGFDSNKIGVGKNTHILMRMMWNKWEFGYSDDEFYMQHRDYTDDNSIGMPTKIEYVHQLQNLYFALTNTELIINL